MPYFLNFQIRCVVRFMRSPGSMFCKGLSHPVSPQTIGVTSIADFVCVFLSVFSGGPALCQQQHLTAWAWPSGRLEAPHCSEPLVTGLPPPTCTGIQLPQSQGLPGVGVVPTVRAYLTALTLAHVIPFQPSSFKAQTPPLKIVKAARITVSQFLSHDEFSHGFVFWSDPFVLPWGIHGSKRNVNQLATFPPLALPPPVTLSSAHLGSTCMKPLLAAEGDRGASRKQK